MSALDNLPPPSEVRSGGQALQVRRLGAGPRLLLLHGGPGLDHHLLLPLAEPLSRSFEIWLPDLPGHGRSHAGDAGLPDLSTVLDRAVRWLEALDPPLPLLAGHSLGAWIVREALRRRRIAPQAAVLIAPPAGAPAGERAGEARAPSKASTARAPRPRERALRDEILDFCTEDTGAEATPDLIAAIARARLRPPGAYTALRGQLRRVLAGPTPACAAPCPVLILSGEADRVCPPTAAALVGAATEPSRWQLIPGLGHVPFGAGAGRVAAAMIEFLERHGPPQAAADRSSTK